MFLFERLMEMNMFLLFMKLARARDDLSQFMELQKKQLRNTRKELQELHGRFRIEQKSNARRRNRQLDWEDNLITEMRELVGLTKHLQRKFHQSYFQYQIFCATQIWLNFRGTWSLSVADFQDKKLIFFQFDCFKV